MSIKSKLLWRCRRGVKELDVVLTRYVETQYDDASDAEKKTFDELLEYQDPDILRFVLRQEVPADEAIADIIEKICNPG
ncbi:MAG: succinate dehydrogenase assembly factor 2 [Gammaproteobacteria bacterium]|nr:MAG: succinate dehydrogenase assembly factor 2 [Gammaproteobacteria bacterium]